MVSIDKNLVNIINYVNIMQGRPYPLCLWSIPLGTILPPTTTTPRPLVDCRQCSEK